MDWYMLINHVENFLSRIIEVSSPTEPCMVKSVTEYNYIGLKKCLLYLKTSTWTWSMNLVAPIFHFDLALKFNLWKITYPVRSFNFSNYQPTVQESLAYTISENPYSNHYAPSQPLCQKINYNLSDPNPTSPPFVVRSKNGITISTTH